MKPRLTPPLLAALFVVLFGGSPTFAQSTQGIAAIVNDEIISEFDLNRRLDIVVKSSGLPNRPDVRKRLAHQVLRRMIDDTLKTQEASRLDVTVSDADIQDALNRLARQNNVDPRDMDAFLARTGIDKDALIQQIEPDIAWAKLLGKTVRPTIQISEEEVDETIAEIEAHAGQPEYHVAEIFLRVDDPSKDSEIRQLAAKLIEQIRDGAPFSAVARSFSQSATAANGGDLGWIRRGDLGPELDEALTKMQPKQVGSPIHTMGGYTILLMIATRTAEGIKNADMTLSLQQIFLPLDAKADRETFVSRLEEARRTVADVKDCAGMQKVADSLKKPAVRIVGQDQIERLAHKAAQYRPRAPDRRSQPADPDRKRRRRADGLRTRRQRRRKRRTRKGPPLDHDAAHGDAGPPTDAKFAATGLRRRPAMTPEIDRAAVRPLALTMGEPAGIGGEIALAAWLRNRDSIPPFFCIDDPERLDILTRRLGWPVADPRNRRSGRGRVAVSHGVAGPSGSLADPRFPPAVPGRRMPSRCVNRSKRRYN